MMFSDFPYHTIHLKQDTLIKPMNRYNELNIIHLIVIEKYKHNLDI
jgi:hypothetical protein